MFTGVTNHKLHPLVALFDELNYPVVIRDKKIAKRVALCGSQQY